MSAPGYVEDIWDSCSGCDVGLCVNDTQFYWADEPGKYDTDGVKQIGTIGDCGGFIRSCGYRCYYIQEEGLWKCYCLCC